MRQMSSLWWLILFLIFSITLMLFNLLNYFFSIYTSSYKQTSSNNILDKTLNWKW